MTTPSEQAPTHHIWYDPSRLKWVLCGLGTYAPVFVYDELELAISGCEKLFSYYASRGQGHFKAIAYDKNLEPVTVLVANGE